MLQHIYMSIRFRNGTQYCPTTEASKRKKKKKKKLEKSYTRNDGKNVGRRKRRIKKKPKNRNCTLLFIWCVCELCIGFNSMFNWFFAIWTVFKYGFPISRSFRSSIFSPCENIHFQRKLITAHKKSN